MCLGTRGGTNNGGAQRGSERHQRSHSNHTGAATAGPSSHLSPSLSSCFLSPQLPLGKIGRGFSTKEPDFHDDYGSLENEDCGDDDDLQGRPEQCRLEGYSSLEVTNV